MYKTNKTTQRLARTTLNNIDVLTGLHSRYAINYEIIWDSTDTNPSILIELTYTPLQQMN